MSQLIRGAKTANLSSRQYRCFVIAEFHYTGPTGPDQIKFPDFDGNPGLRPGSYEKNRASPVGSGRARVVEFYLYRGMLCIHGTSHGPVSVASRSSTKTTKRRITQITPHNSSGILVF